MHVKSLRRIVLMVVAMVASSLSLVAVTSSPASAASYSTTSELEANVTTVVYGGTVTFTGRVYATIDGSDYYVPVGTAKLQRLNYGASTWATIQTKTITEDTGELTWTYKPGATARYRVLYSGGTYEGDVLAPSVSTPLVSVKVKRKITSAGNQSTFVYYGKVTPGYGKRTVVMRKSTCSNPQSSSCTWTTYKNITTTSTGNYSVRLPVYARRTHFRAIVAASNGYLGNSASLIITTYRY